MAPKSSLLTAGTNKLQKRRAPARPMTTQGKIAKAAAKADTRKSVPRPPPADSKPKPRSLPPPGEGLGITKPKSVDKSKGTRRSEPLTTQQKIRAAAAAAKAKGPQSAKPAAAARHAAAANSGPGKLMQAAQNAGSPKKAAKAKAPGMMSVLRTHDASMQKFAKKGEGNAVMYRRTQRAEKHRREKREKSLRDPEIKAIWEDPGVQEMLLKAAKNGKVWKILARKKEEKGVEMWQKLGKLIRAELVALPPLTSVGPGKDESFRLMDLPKELRAEIFKLVVVESKVFIRPDSVIGKEQPDLAMVSKQLRAEVLPVFYGKNTFAIDLPSAGPAKMGRPKCDRSVPLTGLAAIEKWSSALETGGCFGMIRRWVFDYAPAGSWVTGQRTDNGAEYSSLMVSVTFTKKHDSRCWDAAVEIHRDAACVMQAFREHGLCVVKRVPEWLNEAVIEVLDAAKRGSISGGMILGLAKAMKAKVQKLGEFRCEQAVRSIETDSGFGGD
ncbi:hypothetical protein LTR36_005570 [Oleoguttula mirabilis]|uniref:Uncharacterized protein n=1 Tax=Oleoguttula mirabilis TaxID=1507867 RepID=A0AAV9JE22_9PEZI|nr:hypothetical protein LTR36_005570 [Oleoguttula mirabilis]